MSAEKASLQHSVVWPQLVLPEERQGGSRLIRKQLSKGEGYRKRKLMQVKSKIMRGSGLFEVQQRGFEPTAESII